MDYVRGAHDVPWDVKSASLEQFVPPWIARHQIWSDSFTADHSGISTDVLLFTDINLSLTHHYRVHKRGLPHIAFRKNACEHGCHRRWPGLGVRCCHQFRPIQCQRAMLVRLSGKLSRPGEPDVSVIRCGQYESWRNRSVIFRLSLSRILWTCRVPLFTTAGLCCCLCLCASRILGCCLCSVQLFLRAWLRLPRRTTL